MSDDAAVLGGRLVDAGGGVLGPREATAAAIAQPIPLPAPVTIGSVALPADRTACCS